MKEVYKDPRPGYEEMKEQWREITRFRVHDGEEEFKSHQQLRLPQPPLVKEPMGGDRIKLPMNFGELNLNSDYVSLCFNRSSRRVYSGESMSLTELSFLLWATQGVKSIRGNNYATLRTVPCGGARHPFETYLIVMNVDGLKAGKYHYLPMSNEIEFLGEVPNMFDTVKQTLEGQSWGAKANVVFYWSMVPYRSEWRYGPGSPVHALVDVGHIGQALYMACEAAGLGTCGIGAFDFDLCGELFGLDNDEEYIVYSEPVGKVKDEDRAKEDDIYAFVKNEPGAQTN